MIVYSSYSLKDYVATADTGSFISNGRTRNNSGGVALYLAPRGLPRAVLEG
jgi:hypothetical protein